MSTNRWRTRLVLSGLALTAGALPLLSRATPAVSAIRADQPWAVWEKTQPCQDTRQDWFAAAQEDPRQYGSGQLWEKRATFDTSAMAMAAADADKTGGGFDKRCCRDWGVFKNTDTGAFSVARITAGTMMPPPFVQKEQNLCCEEAFAHAGLPVGTMKDCRNLLLSTGMTVTVQPNGTFVPFGGAGDGGGATSSSLAGEWRQESGAGVTIHQDGSNITGSYVGGAGHEGLHGTISDGKLEGHHLTAKYHVTEGSLDRTGHFDLTVSDDGKTLDGTYTSDDGTEHGNVHWTR